MAAACRSARNSAARTPISAPYGVYPAKDGYLAIAMTPIAKIQQLLDIPELIAFNDNPSSWFTDRDTIKQIISKKIETGTIDEWLAVLEPADIWCAKVLNWDELMEHDGFKVLDILQRVERDDNVSILTTCSPLRVNGVRPHHNRAAPRVGEHSAKIRSEFAL